MDTRNQNRSPQERSHIRRLMIFFALVYIAEGLGQVAGLIHQPLQYYFKQVYGWGPEQVTNYLAVLTFPWVIKPIYGIISDFIPLFGYRRRTYLFLANALAVGGYLWITGLTHPSQIIIALFLTAFGMAASSTLCGAVLVENGQKTGLSGTFVNQQWLWFNIAAVVTSFAGGWMIDRMGAETAFHTAALIVAFAPIGVMLGCWFLIQEEKAKVNLTEFKNSSKALLSAFKNKTLWVVAGFLFFFNFSPSFGVPLYYYETDHLHFSQEFIGILGGLGAIGSILGAFLYMWLEKRMTMKGLLNLSILLGILSQGSFVLLNGQTSAIVLTLVNGVAAMIALVATLTLAADYCPQRAEGFSYAILMSVNNLATQLSQNVGSSLYEKWFHSQLNPLILLSCVCTAAIFLIVPVLKLGNRKPGEKFDHDVK